ncbi:NAD(+) diphosphatase [Stutzerimonas tarimensis]|uniref:NAD-capped RNA hydrolase NudC n=1 Tax=Stutzerimonas tarimensis TaxID=1507735 RepID=A0ABV7T281_9GAMM
MMSRWQPALPDAPVAGGRVLVFARQRFFLRGDDMLHPATVLRALPLRSCQVLGYFDGEPIQLAELAELPAVAEGEWVGLRQFMRDDIDPDLFRLLCYGAQIGTWLGQHRFCGSCGGPMAAAPGERAMRCERCDLQHYPRLSPCMITLVTRADEVLLARSSRHAPGMYSTLAGFVEPGETVEQCVVREVFEEVGVQVSELRYMGSQNWPFPHALMLGFHAEYVGGEIVPQPEEIEDARWFAIDRLPALPGRRSIARYLIDRYVAARLGEPLPSMPDW